MTNSTNRHMRARQFVIAFICFAGAGSLFYFSSEEYRLAIIIGFVLVSIFWRVRFAMQVGLQLLMLFNVRVLSPVLALLLWMLDHLPFSRTITPLRARSRADLKQLWSDSWLTVPVRLFRSRRR